MLSQTHAHSSQQYVNPLWCLLVICRPFLGLLERTNMCIWCFCAGENNVRMERIILSRNFRSIHPSRQRQRSRQGSSYPDTREEGKRKRENTEKNWDNYSPWETTQCPSASKRPISSLSPAPNLLVGLWIQSMDPSTHYRQSPPDAIISEDALRDTLRGVLHFSPKDFCQVDS